MAGRSPSPSDVVGDDRIELGDPQEYGGEWAWPADHRLHPM